MIQQLEINEPFYPSRGSYQFKKLSGTYPIKSRVVEHIAEDNSYIAKEWANRLMNRFNSDKIYRIRLGVPTDSSRVLKDAYTSPFTEIIFVSKWDVEVIECLEWSDIINTCD